VTVLPIIALVVVAYLPGALIFRIPVAGRESRAGLAAEERVFWAVIISAACSSAMALALAAASLYRLERLVAGDLLLSMLVAGAWRQRLLYRGTARAPRWSALVPLALVVLGWSLFFPTAEYVMGGKDPGTYINEGIAIARGGSLLIREPVVASLPAWSRDLFFPSYQNATYYSLRFMGFFLVDPVSGTVVGQFPHLYPVWIAIGYGLNGVPGALHVVGVWAILGLLAVYFTGVRLVGRPAAATAATLLAISLVQIWFARYPNSETVTEAFLFAAILSFARAHVDDDRFFAPVAGLLFGLLVFLRIDTVLALGAVGVTAGLLLTGASRTRVVFWLPLVLVLGAGWLYYATLMRPYGELPMIFAANLRPVHLALASGGVIGLLAFLLAARSGTIGPLLRTWGPRALALLLLAGTAYGYFFRAPTGRLAWHDAMSLRTFTWYLPPAALAAAVLGYAWLCWRRFWRDPLLLVTIAVYAFFVFYKIRIWPEHFWMARRFVPVILPSALLMLSALAWYDSWRPRGLAPGAPHDKVTASGGLKVVRFVLPAAFLLLVGLTLWRATTPILRHVEYAGLVTRLEDLARRFTADDLVLVESRASGGDLHVFAPPLSYIYNRNILVLFSPTPAKPPLGRFLAWAHTKYRHVYFIGMGGSDLRSRSIAAEPVGRISIRIPEYESLRNEYPTHVRVKDFDFGIYRLRLETSTPGGFSLDVGALDDVSVLRFHAKQVQDQVTYRWSRDISYVALPGLGPGVSSVRLSLSNGGRPVTVGPAQVTISLDDRPLGQAIVTGGFHTYSFAIPPDLAAAIAAKDDPARLKIECPTWNPRAALGIPDDRDLGVMVDRVDVE
jgi:hypothetical protein